EFGAAYALISGLKNDPIRENGAIKPWSRPHQKPGTSMLGGGGWAAHAARISASPAIPSRRVSFIKPASCASHYAPDRINRREKKPGSKEPGLGIGHVRPTQSPSKRDY